MRSAVPPPLFHGKAVLLSFADNVNGRDRRLISASLAGLVERIAEAYAGEDAVVLPFPFRPPTSTWSPGWFQDPRDEVRGA